MTQIKRRPENLPRRRKLARAVMLGLTMASALGAATAQAAAVVPLSGLNGTTGFRLDGVAANDFSGCSVASAGDVNGDGLDDFVIGANGADPNGFASGSSYVVFGRSGGFASAVALSSLDGTTGFRLDGVATVDYSGASVASAGDVNGDGLDDLIIGAHYADPSDTSSGTSYVVFGRSGGFASSVPLSSLDGTTGFRLDGVAIRDYSGRSVAAAGDVNGDGLDDLVIGAYRADPTGSYSGSSYVVFGRSGGFASAINLSSLDGTTGFRLDGVAAYDFSGRSVASAGDVNGDGLDDLIVGAFGADPNGSRSGSSYVVFGRSGGFASAINLSMLDGTTGFRLDGVATRDYSGSSVAAAGDVNGDGLDDLVIGAYRADPNGSYSGSSYVVFGRSGGFASSVPLSSLDGTTGFRLDGVAEQDFSGRSVASAGDVNGDGLDDLIIGARHADPNGYSSGSSYVVFGRSGGFASVIPLSSLDGTTGFRLDGVTTSDSSGSSVASAGDVNGDGLDDLIIGAFLADPNGIEWGSSYVVFGNAAPLVAAGGPVQLAAVLEDSASPVGTRVDNAALPSFLDLDSLAGAGVTATPPISDGAWQYSLDVGANWQALPAALSTADALVLLTDSQLRFVPATDFVGDSPPLSLRLWDGADGFSAGEGRDISRSIDSLGGFSNDANLLSILVPITPVNDAPAFTATNPPATNEGAGAHSVAGVGSGFSPGPANESAQTLTGYLVSNLSDATLFTVAPVAASDGTLTYTTAPDAFGTATLELRTQDSGGSANGGIDTSAPQTVTITINPVNDAPSFTASDPPSVRDDVGLVQLPGWASFSPGPANESDQFGAWIVVDIANPALFALAPQAIGKSDGTLQYAPAAGVSGSSAFTVRVRDSGGTSNGGVDLSATQTFTITVLPSTNAIFCDGFETLACAPTP